MPRSIVLSNSYLSVTLDEDGYVRDMFYPHVGLENHVNGHKHRIGISIDGYFSWLDSPEWEVKARYHEETMIGEVRYFHREMGVEIISEDAVYNELPIFLRRFEIHNPGLKYTDIKMFFSQEFSIGEVRLRNTAFYDPTKNAIVHYKGRRVFLVNGRSDHQGMDDYTVGVFKFAGKEGSFRDAEDGELSKNAVEHGPVDSVFRVCASCEKKEVVEVHYWICAAESIDDVYTLNDIVQAKSVPAMLRSTSCFWNAWSHTYMIDFLDLPTKVQQLYYNSLLILRCHVDHDGGIIASLDSEMLLYGKDSYAYVWPRDGAYVSVVLDKAGYTHVTKPFFEFCRDVLHPDGYLHHKFQSDKSLGSTWQSSIKQNDWLKDRILQLPIQEDETASVLHALWIHFTKNRDIEFIEELYKSFIEKAADFLVAFRDEKTGLPIHSYDLWEEVTGVSTYTCASVYGGLQAAANFCELLGKTSHAKRYRTAADEIVTVMKQYLFNKEMNSFIRYATNNDGHVEQHKVVDISSLYGLWYYDVLQPGDPMLEGTIQAVYDRLAVPGGIGGFVRYENDSYHSDPDTFPNPWIITTLWEVQRRLKYAESLEELQTIMQEITWVTDRMGDSPVLAEQYHPYTGEARSVSPLAWSHAVFVETVLMYLERMEEFGVKTSSDLRAAAPLKGSNPQL
ncbi:glycoside hydrolase family 15 protein [Candidatus Woesebacteria bacterium]|nr:glycoside hydrolase family 15 protein [Candidatus Woesebacteria bacterium]MCD8506927.1 glycoside hydrolase family 15 protein [Candidatus Woesebacteria bacterium]MCD8527217.1 glycoside hydrolase family 15 protein [Candidatus Woesebacteria bacterium]MCD8546582.1 glycoside hydrolase family 15 protein [Candidatus Woesebacteria bacterium]